MSRNHGRASVSTLVKSAVAAWIATDVDLAAVGGRDRRDDVVTQVEQQVGGGLVLRRRRREDLHDRDGGVGCDRGGGRESHSRVLVERVASAVTAAWSPGVLSWYGDEERSVDARPEALGA